MAVITPQVKSVVSTVKAGYRTSEFWMHATVQVLTWVANGMASSNDQHLALAGLSVLALLGYTASRTVVKNASGAGTTTTQLGAAVTAVEQDARATESAVAAAVSDVVTPQ